MRNLGVVKPRNAKKCDYYMNDILLTGGGKYVKIQTFGQQHVSSAGFPTPTSLASAARIFIKAA